MKKGVLIPGRQIKNPFFDIIVDHCEWQFDYSSIDNSIDGYAVVLILWPEHIFHWKEPDKVQLKQLRKQFSIWKKDSKIVYQVNNLKRHKGMTPNFEELYKMVIDNCDAMVHLGHYSLELYKKEFPNKIHRYIPHPLYNGAYKQYEKIEARAQLGISNKKLIVLVPGAIRSLEERRMILKGFRKIKFGNKIMVVSKMYKKEVNIEFKGRHRIKKYFDLKKILEYIYNKDYDPKYKFSYKFTEVKKLSLLLSASDIIMIPRRDSLNSGILFLGLTFKKVILGPEIGNIEEFLKYFNLPTFNPMDNHSVGLAFNEAVKLSRIRLPYSDEMLKNFLPKEVASDWDDFLDELVSPNFKEDILV